LIKHIIYNTTVSLLPKNLLITLGSLKIFESLRDWLFDRNKILKPCSLISWNNLEFYFHAPLQILRKARMTGIENSLTQAILKVIDKDSSIIDIGANYGFITLACSKYICDGEGIIYSFECDTNYFKNLKSSIAKNNLTNIEYFNVFIGNRDDENAKTVDSFISDKCDNVGLIKIDTDGTDLDCLKGCSKIIKRFQPVIVIEINNNLDEIADYLKILGYEYFYNQFFKKIEFEADTHDRLPNLLCSTHEFEF